MSNCNGYNHPSWCECDFSGGRKGNLSSSDYYAGLPSRYIWVKWCESLTTPNAICPVCNSSVFFYSNKQGSKVYFDSLGSPWPIHPCVNKENSKIKHKLTKKLTPSKSLKKSSDNFVRSILVFEKMDDIKIFDIKYGGRLIRFYCKCFESIGYLNSIKNKIKIDALTMGRMRFQLGPSSLNKIIGYPSIKNFGKPVSRLKMREWNLWDGKLKLDYGTSMAGAMARAIKKRN